MDRNDFEYTVFSGSERARISMLDLPIELNQWVSTNKELVTRIQDSLSNTYETLTEDSLWGIIAQDSSDDWREAKNELTNVQSEWDELNSPSTVPLGLIGGALESHIFIPVAEKLSYSLSNFTIINEGLKEREDLAKLLQVLKIVNRIVDQSKKSSKNMIGVTETLSNLDIPSSRTSFNENSVIKAVNDDKIKAIESIKTNEEKSSFSIIELFHSYAKKLFQSPKDNRKKSKPLLNRPKSKPAL